MERAQLNRKIKGLIEKGYFPILISPEDISYCKQLRVKPSPLRSFFNKLLPRELHEKMHKDEFPPSSYLSALASARCLDDGTRTKVFYKAVQKAVREINKSKPDGSISVCDAGCGAFPVLSIATALASENVQVLALEGNSLSAEIARSVINTLGLSKKIQVINCDATKYKANKEFDLIVSETVFTALWDEPVAQITQHLKQFARHDAFIIPESMQIFVALADTDGVLANEEAYMIQDKFYKSIPEESFRKVFMHKFGNAAGKVSFSLNSEDFYHTIMLASTLRVHGELELKIYDSIITAPLSLPERYHSPANHQGRKVEISYAMGEIYKR